MKKVIKLTTLLITSLFSTITFAHTGHENSNIFHLHSDSGYILVLLIVGLLVGYATYHDYKKNVKK